MDNSFSETTEAPRDQRANALGDLRVLPDEILCDIFERLSPRDVPRLACVSSENSQDKCKEDQRQSFHFDGFNSLFLYRRLYRCHTTLDGYYADDGNEERRKGISLKDFYDVYDSKKPVILTGLADMWPARNKWTTDQLLLNYGDVAFKISQRSYRKIKIKLKDYVFYTKLQHDEDPLYIFDEKFGEAAPSLLKDYFVPHLFEEDYFDVLDTDKRPSYRWLIIGPERSGASRHVDPALTSLYPPGKVPLGVIVHVNEEDGDGSIDPPSSLQWWLDFYPLLADEDIHNYLERQFMFQVDGGTVF